MSIIDALKMISTDECFRASSHFFRKFGADAIWDSHQRRRCSLLCILILTYYIYASQIEEKGKFRGQTMR